MCSRSAAPDPAAETARAHPSAAAVSLGASGGAAATAGEAATIADPATIGARSDRSNNLEFHLAVDIVYNRARAGWLLLWHRAFLFGTIIAGSVAASDVSNPKLCAVLAAVLAAFDLVFDPGAGAAAHGEIVRELHAVLIRLTRAKFSEAEMDRAEGDLLTLSATERAPYCAQRDIAHNQAITALGRDPTHRAKIGWRRGLSQVFRFEGR